MGVLVGGKCYANDSDGADAFYTGQNPVLSAGAVGYSTWYEKVGTTWQIKRQSISETGIVTDLPSVGVSVPAFPFCDEAAPFNDGLAVGWLVAGVLLCSWGALQVKRLIR